MDLGGWLRKSRSRRVCGGLSRERDRRARSLSCNGGRPPADWRLGGRGGSAQAARRNRELAGASLSMEPSPTPSSGLRPENPEAPGRAPPHHRERPCGSCRIDRPCAGASLDVEDWRVLLEAPLPGRRGLGRGVANGRSCRQDARRRVDSSVRTPDRGGERSRNAPFAPRSPFSARSPNLIAKNDGSGQPKLDARIGIERAGRWSWMRPEKSLAMRPTSPRACRP